MHATGKVLLKSEKMYSNGILTDKQLIDSKKQIRNLSYDEKQNYQTFKKEYDKMKLGLEVCRLHLSRSIN